MIRNGLDWNMYVWGGLWDGLGIAYKRHASVFLVLYDIQER